MLPAEENVFQLKDLERSQNCYATCRGLKNCEYGGWISFVPEISYRGTQEIFPARCKAFFDEEERKKKHEYADFRQRQIEEAVGAGSGSGSGSGKLPERLRECTFKSFVTDGLPDTALAKKLAIKAFREYSSIVFAGSTGVGKTHLAAAILNSSFISGRTGLFMPFVSLLTDLKNSFENDTTGRIIEALRTVDCLVLDDVGQETQTNYSSERLFEIVDYRYNRYRQIVITTNCFNWKALERKIGERGTYIVRRLKSMGTLILIDAPTYLEGEGKWKTFQKF